MWWLFKPNTVLDESATVRSSNNDLFNSNFNTMRTFLCVFFSFLPVPCTLIDTATYWVKSLADQRTHEMMIK